MPTPEPPKPLARLRTRKHVAAWIGVTDEQLRLLLYGRPEWRRYTQFEIAKRRGGKRIILAPMGDLKLVQQKLAAKLDEVYMPRDVAFGFIAGRGVAGNADCHLRRRHVLNVDLKDFFPTINFGRVRGLFLKLGAGKKAATTLAHVCCHKGALPQGAPTSPVLSNMICSRMDREMAKLAATHHCRYSRYADDLSFSKKSGAFPAELARLDEVDGRAVLGNDLRGVIEKNGFSPHPEKVWLFTRQQRQVVTGLVVNVKRNVRREWVRQLRAMLHAWEKFGLKAAEAEYQTKYFRGQKRKGEPGPFREVVRGKMEYLKMVKGSGDPVYNRLQQQLVKLDPEYQSVMEKENAAMKQRDVFISHAWEDKKDVAKKLADRLISLGVTVWYDEYAIRLGDDLLEKIDEGLRHSKYGAVILSPDYFAAKKTWTKREYSGLVAGEDVEKTSRIIPIWHKLTKAEVYERSPTIANRLALLTADLSIAEMAERIAKHVSEATAASP